jgi:crotonobetainyl-CoA:carnitine CoA-transferase CaiB-like acyl-CoA transferase
MNETERTERAERNQTKPNGPNEPNEPMNGPMHITDQPKPTGPLSGYRVLDLSTVVMGPYATQLLGDMGADVIKVEEAAGDLSRAMGPGRHPEFGGTALNLHRNKRSMLLDLKDPARRSVIEALVRSSDVIVTNLRPGPLSRLRLSYDDCIAIRPDVVFCQAQGWPTDSADADRPAYDDIIQSATGAADMMERGAGKVTLYPTIVADKVSGLMIVNGVVAALLHRQKTGLGQRIEVPMIDAFLSFHLVEHLSGATMEPPLASTGYARVVSPERGPKRAADGWITVLPYDDRHWQAMFAAGGRADLASDPRFASARARAKHPDELYTELGHMVASKTVAEWVAICAELGIAAEPVASLDQAVDAAMARGAITLAEHPVVGAYRQVVPAVRFSETPQNVWRPAPGIGEHTAEILAELGFA